MNEYEAKKILSKYCIKVPRGVLIKSIKDLEGLSLQYPLVAKVASEEILHKTDVGGVVLGIDSEEKLRSSVEKLIKKFNSPVLVEEMLKGEIEAIVGVLNDPSFGHAIMFGLGGIFTEVFKDVTFRVIPINRKDAEMMLGDIRGRKILEGYRGKVIDREALIDLLLKVSKVVEDNPEIEGMDLNPVLLMEKGYAVLDAKIIMKR